VKRAGVSRNSSRSISQADAPDLRALRDYPKGLWKYQNSTKIVLKWYLQQAVMWSIVSHRESPWNAVYSQRALAAHGRNARRDWALGALLR